MVNRFAKLFYREKTIKKLNRKIKLLGIDTKYNALTFMNIRIITSILLFLIILISFKLGYLSAPIITYFYYRFLPNIYFDSKIKKRAKLIDREGLYYFEILALSLESGNNLTSAITKSCKSIDSNLSKEFREVIREVNFGKSLDEALLDMKERIPSDAINNIILNIRESNIFGNNIIDTLYNQIDYIREKIILETRANISKMPIKISIISVLFFIPLLLLLILGPVLLKYLLR